MVHGIEHGTKRWRRAGHFQTDIKAFGHAQFSHHIIKVFFRDVNRTGDTHFARQLKAVFVNIGDHHIACTNVFRHRRSHNTYRTCTRNQHIFAHQIERQRGMHGVTEGIKNGSQIIGDIVGDFESVERRNHQILGEAARTVNADADRVAAQMGTTATTVATVTAGDMAFARNAIADFEAFHFLTNTYHFTDIFMAYDHRHRDGFLRPLIPVIDVNVSPADGCFTDFNQQIVMPEFRYRNVGHPDALFRFQFG